jgi:lysophospholipase L1-like esterase
MNAATESLTFTVIGDSAAFGTGDLDENGNPRGWGYYLSRVFNHQTSYFNFSRPGAQSAEVRSVQLQKALESKPDICAVICGGNDMLRNGFSPSELHENLVATCRELISLGSEILMIQLHDPNQLLRIPRLLKRVIKRRVDAVNSVYEKVAEELDVILIQTRKIPNVHDTKNWYIDRMHPGPYGHKILAREMAAALAIRGWDISIPDLQDHDRESRAEKILWLIKNGTPWFLKRSIDLLPAALILMAWELCKVIRELFSK